MVVALIFGKDVREAIHAASLDPGASANERERLGHVSYYLRDSTADIIATMLNNRAMTRPPAKPMEPAIRGVLESARDRIKDMLKGDDGQAWKEAEKALPAIEAALAQDRAASPSFTHPPPLSKWGQRALGNWHPGDET